MRTQTVSKLLCGALWAAAAASIPRTASAEEALALERFHPAPAGDRMFGVQSPFAAGSPGIHVMLLGDYAHNPLVLRATEDDDNLGAVVGNQLYLHLNGTLALWNRLAVNVDVPVALLQNGDNPNPDGTGVFQSPSGAAFGDLRLGLRFRILGDYFDAFQLAVGGYVWIPTGSGDDGSFVSDGSVRGLPQLLVGGRTDRIVWSFAAGPEIRAGKDFAGVAQGTAIQGGAGVGFLLGDERRLQIGPEINISTVFEDPNARNTNAEILLDARYRFFRDFEAGIGVGPGLTSGVGTPDLRVVAMVAFTPDQAKPVPPGDRDKDGIADPDDACPDVPGVANEDPTKNGCPPPEDRDKDGIPDDVDACPDVPGVPSADPKKNGCPLPQDRDKDGITDNVDACPDVPGVASADPKKNGCPPDKDGDGVIDAKDACVDIPGIPTSDPATNGCPGDTDNDTIRDDKDACPREKGKPNPDPAKNGCPESVRVSDVEIIILKQVQFDTNRATIKRVSDPLLNEVAEVMKEHPEIIKIEVQGHTDNTGSPKINDPLSQNRANAVMAALVKRGVDAGRLTAKGYGQSAPIDTNDTPEGRQKNRRVQFKIIEKKAPPK